MSKSVDAVRAAVRGTPEAPSHPDERMLAVDARFSDPRFVFVTEAELDSMAASPGMYAYVAATPGSKRSDRVVQRVGSHWEIVAEPLLGDMTAKGDKLVRETPVPFGLSSGGGSGVSVAPRGPGDPSVTDPMAGLTPQATLGSLEVYTATVHEASPLVLIAGAPETLLYTLQPISYGGSPPAQLTSVATVFMFFASATPAGLETVTFRVYADGALLSTNGFNAGNVWGFHEDPLLWGAPWFTEGAVVTVTAQASVGNVTLVLPQIGDATTPKLDLLWPILSFV